MIRRTAGIRFSQNNIDDYFPPQNNNEDAHNNPGNYGPLGRILIPHEHLDDPDALQNRLRIFSLSVLFSSIFFWCWALLNTYHLRKNGGLDLGIISFFGSGLSSALLLRSSLGGKWYDSNQRFGCFGKRGDNVDDDDLYLSSSSGRNNKNIPSKHSPPGQALRIFVVISQLTVVCNYLLGLLFACTAGNRVYVYFATYCSIFLVLWIVVCYVGFVLVKVYRKAVGEEVLNNDRNESSVSLLRRLLLLLVNIMVVRETEPRSHYEEEEEEIEQELMALCENNGTTYSNTS
jgi:hypothetical protein